MATHHHDHAHCRAGDENVSEVNRKYWNEKAAARYEEPWVKALTAQQTATLAANADWLGLPHLNPPSQARLFDYACGNGAVSMSLLDRFSVLRGIDTSDVMVRLYNERVEKAGLDRSRMLAVEGDLTKTTGAASRELDKPEWNSFDTILICMALHHIADPAGILRTLSERLAPGGSLIAIDWSTENGVAAFEEMLRTKKGDVDVAKTVSRQGYTEGDMLGLFEKAGFEKGACGYRVFEEGATIPEEVCGVEGGAQWRMFIARARKAA